MYDYSNNNNNDYNTTSSVEKMEIFERNQIEWIELHSRNKHSRFFKYSVSGI